MQTQVQDRIGKDKIRFNTGTDKHAKVLRTESLSLSQTHTHTQPHPCKILNTQCTLLFNQVEKKAPLSVGPQDVLICQQVGITKCQIAFVHVEMRLLLLLFIICYYRKCGSASYIVCEVRSVRERERERERE